MALENSFCCRTNKAFSPLHPIIIKKTRTLFINYKVKCALKKSSDQLILYGGIDSVYILISLSADLNPFRGTAGS